MGKRRGGERVIGVVALLLFGIGKGGSLGEKVKKLGGGRGLSGSHLFFWGGKKKQKKKEKKKRRNRPIKGSKAIGEVAKETACKVVVRVLGGTTNGNEAREWRTLRKKSVCGGLAAPRQWETDLLDLLIERPGVRGKKRESFVGFSVSCGLYVLSWSSKKEQNPPTNPQHKKKKKTKQKKQKRTPAQDGTRCA